MLGAQGGQVGGGQSAPLVARFGVGLFDPAEPALSADSVADREDVLAVQVRRPLSPAPPSGEIVAATGVQLGHLGPASGLSRSVAAEPPQSLPHRLTP
jgi:hypothetical protein